MKNLNARLLDSGLTLPVDLHVNLKKKLPEKILQFGEGNFLRGFVDWMIDKMNEQGLFNGRVVVAQPIEEGLVEVLNNQDGLYTLYLRGMQDGITVEQKSIISSISRGINLYIDFESYMKMAESEDLRFVISNTTEAGIAYSPHDRPTDTPPVSYPGKLAILLYRRFKTFSGDPAKGLVIIPCELIDRNGDRLKEIVLRLSREWGYEEEFIRWLETSNHFLNSLVDRIVTGYPKDEAQKLAEELGYNDKLLDTGEIFHLWVIEGDKKFAEELPFTKAGLNVIWTDDMTPYRSRKVRILNGAHTMTVLAAYLYGLDTVKECMDDGLIKAYMEKGLYEEIIPTLDLPENELLEFAKAVSERFANPFIKHYLLSISLNSTSKFKTRVLPSIIEYVERKGKIPQTLAFSLAALIAFYRGTEISGNVLKGSRNTGTEAGNQYDINDDKDVLEMFQKLWKAYESGSMKINELTSTVLSGVDMWGLDLNTISGFTAMVAGYLQKIVAEGVAVVMQQLFLRQSNSPA
jgi:tagaturonate reductase